MLSVDKCLQELARFVGNTYDTQPRADRIRHLAEMLREELVDLLTVRACLCC